MNVAYLILRDAAQNGGVLQAHGDDRIGQDNDAHRQGAEDLRLILLHVALFQRRNVNDEQGLVFLKLDTGALFRVKRSAQEVFLDAGCRQDVSDLLARRAHQIHPTSRLKFVQRTQQACVRLKVFDHRVTAFPRWSLHVLRM